MTDVGSTASPVERLVAVPDLPGVAAFLAETVDLDRAPGRNAGLDETGTALSGLNLAPGSPVLIAMPNGTAMLTAFFAVLFAGAVPVPIAPAAGAERITEIADRLGAAALIAPRIDPARYRAARSYPCGAAQAVVFPAETRERVQHRVGDVVLMTSGTAGIASGCLHGLDALVRNASRHATAIGQRADDTVLVNLPLHYSYALVAQALAALVRGSRLVISGPPFTARGYVEAIRDHRITVSSLTPSAAVRLVEEGVSRPERLRVLTVGGDRLDPARITALLAGPGRPELYLTYGLTEAGPRVATLAAHEEPTHRWSSVGLPLPGVRTGLRPDGLGEGGGELIVTSDTVLQRRLPNGTPSPRRGPRVVATGDRFVIDADGYHYFRGRLGDSIIVGGEKVWLPSVRQIAAAVPGVRHCDTTVYRDDRDEVRYDLEVSVAEPGPDQAQIQRALNRVLLRGERPHRITVRPARDEEWRK